MALIFYGFNRMKKVYNFSAGPAMLPVPVMEQAKNFCWNDLGISAMEVSHRSTDFIALMDRARAIFVIF